MPTRVQYSLLLAPAVNPLIQDGLKSMYLIELPWSSQAKALSTSAALISKRCGRNPAVDKTLSNTCLASSLEVKLNPKINSCRTLYRHAAPARHSCTAPWPKRQQG